MAPWLQMARDGRFLQGFRGPKGAPQGRLPLSFHWEGPVSNKMGRAPDLCNAKDSHHASDRVTAQVPYLYFIHSCRCQLSAITSLQRQSQHRTRGQFNAAHRKINQRESLRCQGVSPLPFSPSAPGLSIRRPPRERRASGNIHHPQATQHNTK